jgi:hypothetical protein
MTPGEINNTYKIEKNVPIPKLAHHKFLDKYWNKMEIGDSILLPLNEIKHLMQSLKLSLKGEHYGLYKTKKEGNWYRLWKIKERGRKEDREYSEGTIRSYQYRKGKTNGRS